MSDLPLTVNQTCDSNDTELPIHLRQDDDDEYISRESNSIFQKYSLKKWLDEELEISKHRRFIGGTLHVDRVKKSLALFDKSKDFPVSLLLTENQKIYESEHRYQLNKKLSSLVRGRKRNAAKFEKIKKGSRNNYPTDEASIADQCIRFCTIIHSVTALNIDDAVNDAHQLKEIFTQCVKDCKGLECYGVLEAEIISHRKLEALQKYEILSDLDNLDTFNKYKTYVKLVNTKILGESLGASILNGEDGQICIHLHVMLFAKNKDTFNKFESDLKSKNLWNNGIKQIQIKCLSKKFNGKNKSITKSIKDIAKYMSKGGTILHNHNPSLRYKISLTQDKLTSYDEFLCTEYQFEEGMEGSDFSGNSTDFLSLSPVEIYTLHEVNEQMMNFDDSRTGHIMKIGRWY